MKIIEGQIENLFVHKAKYDFIKNRGKQAAVSAALGAAVGSTALASQAILIANSQWDVKECSFELNGQKYEGLFEEIYFSNHAQLICLVQDHIALVLIDPNDNKMYIPIGTGETVKQLKKKYIYMYFGCMVIAMFVLFFSNGDFNFVILAIFLSLVISYFFVMSMYKPEKIKGILTEKIMEFLGFENNRDVKLRKYSFGDDNKIMTMSWVIEYQNAFKENNPYPKDYFEKK
jgi:Ca2+/Na+ antiporter